MNEDNQMNQMPTGGQNLPGQDAPSKGPVIGILIIALLIILGGIYILTSRDNNTGVEPAPTDSPAGRDDENLFPPLEDSNVPAPEAVDILPDDDAMMDDGSTTQ